MPHPGGSLDGEVRVAGPYLFCNIVGAGVYAWDTSTDTAYGSNPVLADSFQCNRSFLALSGDATTLYCRGSNGTGNNGVLAKLSTGALTHTILPANFGTLGGSGECLAASNDGTEVYAPIAGTSLPFDNALLAINGSTGNVRQTTGNILPGSTTPQRIVESYDSTTLYTAEAGSSTFGKITVSSMAHTVIFGAPVTINPFITICGLSADGTVLYGLYEPATSNTVFAGVLISNGSVVGSYAFPYASTAVYPVLSADRAYAYIARAVSPFNVVVVRLSDFSVVRQDAITTGQTLIAGSLSQDGRYIYYASGSNPIHVSKYDAVAGTFQSFTMASAAGSGGFDAVLSPLGWPFTATTPPATPTGLKWNSPICEGNQVTLSWMIVSMATGFNIYRGGVKIASNVASPPYVDTTAVAGASYLYQVSAVNAGGESALSPAVLVTPCPLPPTPPHGCYSREAGCNGTMFTRQAIPVTAFTREANACDCN
jgi:hypothetical protein